MLSRAGTTATIQSAAASLDERATQQQVDKVELTMASGYHEWSAELVNAKVAGVRSRSRLGADGESGGSVQAQSRQAEFVAAAIEMQMAHKRSELQWRSDREYCCRLSLAWAFNWGVMITACLFAITYGIMLEDAATQRMAITWLISYGITFAIIEPVQVLLMTAAPWLFEDTTQFGRLCLRCRAVYNELCAP